MSELIDTSHSFYLNCEEFNNTDSEIDAIQDRDDFCLVKTVGLCCYPFCT